MSKQIKDSAKEYLRAGLSVIPTKEDKLPALPTWKPYQSQRMKEEEVEALFSGANVKGLSIICGAISGNLEVIDVDTKHDTTGSLWDEFRGLIEANLPEIYSSLVIAQTKSGGYHIYYRAKEIKGNLKLASKKNKEVLIETRGEGGYVIAPPTTGYNYLQGEPGSITTITKEDRDILHSIAKSFNELEEVKKKVNSTSVNTISVNSQTTGLTSYEDYNQRGDVKKLLQDYGYTIVGETNDKFYILRPGQTDSKTSGNFHKSLRTLRVFSTSTEFSSERAYSPAQVFCFLACNKNEEVAYRRLLENGYGEPGATYRKLSALGYGGSSGGEIRPTQVKTEKIKVEIVVNSVNRETSVISTPGDSLKIENIQTAVGDEVVITSPGSEATEEVLKAISLIQETGKKVSIKEGDIEIREYRYQLNALIVKYGTIQDESGVLTDRDIHNLLDEIVITATRLQPLDRDIFKKIVLDLEAIKELGITEESLSITVDRLTSTKDKEAQAKDFKKLLSEATQLQDKGDIDKALEVLDKKVKEVKLKDKATEFSSLIKPIKEDEIRGRLSERMESVYSGYTIGKEPLLLPAGAISIFTAPTSHGKTTFLINLALNVAEANPDKETYLFSYEEDGDSILINTLNTYLDNEVSVNNRKSIRSYFTTGSTEFLKPHTVDFFKQKKEKFFKELIDTRRLSINYSSYDSDTLIESIRYLHKHANPGAIFIDYVQLLNLPQGKYKTYSRQEEMKEICIALKDLAVETGLPIILGAQFNREVVNHIRIHATKIGEAGDLERIANLIVGFWNNNFKPIGTDAELKEISNGKLSPGTIYTEVLKNRGGRVGMSELLFFNGNTGKIKNDFTTDKDSLK